MGLQHKGNKRTICAWIIGGLLCCLGATVVLAQSSDYAWVFVDGRKVLELGGDGKLSAAQRASKINHRLTNLIERTQTVVPFRTQDLRPHDKATDIQLGNDLIMSVTEADAQDALTTREELARRWGGRLSEAIQSARAARSNPLYGGRLAIQQSFTDLMLNIARWLPRLAAALLLWGAFWLLARMVKRVTQRTTTRMSMDKNNQQIILALVYYGTWTFCLMAVLMTLGWANNNIAAAVGVSGFVVGFAFKDILSHFFAGLLLLFGRQFQIGDQIVVKDFEGTVERIELRALHLRTYDNRLVMIPNGDVITSIVTSNTASPYRRREVVLPVGYAVDIEQARQVALKAMQATEGVQSEPPPDVLVDDLGPTQVQLRLRFHANSLRAEYVRVSSACIQNVKEAFEQAGIGH